MNTRVQSYLALFPLCLFLAAAQPATAETVLHVAYEDKTQFPYYMGDTQRVLEKPGAAVELVKLLEERIPGLRIKFSRYPWKRCLTMLKTGQVDGIFNASFNTSRTRIGEYPWEDGQVDPSRRLTTISYYLYTLPNTEIGWNGEAFEDPDISITGDVEVNDVQNLTGEKLEQMSQDLQGRLFERDIFMEKFLTAADGAEDNQRSALFKKI